MRVKSVLLISSEVEPYAKSGGLADVISSLAKSLRNKGLDVKIILPLYASIDYQKYGLSPRLESAAVHMGGCEEWFSVHSTIEPYGVDTIFIECNKYFGRIGFYNDCNGEYDDNLARFAFFSKASLQTAKDLNFRPDIVHVNDWQTSLVPYYMRTYNDIFFINSYCVLTIHNLGYQGVFSRQYMDYAMITPWDFTSNKFEAYGCINLLKGGIFYSDKISTVSPSYAEEILTPIGSNGLHHYLHNRISDIKGILNGIDSCVWNPKTDTLISHKYNGIDYKTFKAENKRSLQQEFNLEELPNVPIFVVVSRFAEQKGLNVLMDIMDKVLNNMICQFIIIGSGDRKLEAYFTSMPAKYPRQVGSFIGYSERLAHIAEAGGDFFVMPSLYEPCGLNQMYSQIYGTLPIVRSVGGLRDTVMNYDEIKGVGTGFKFHDLNPTALYYTIGWAISTYFDRPNHIDNMIKISMGLNYSWDKSADEYISFYCSAIN